VWTRVLQDPVSTRTALASRLLQERIVIRITLPMVIVFHALLVTTLQVTVSLIAQVVPMVLIKNLLGRQLALLARPASTQVPA
jgi:hypothetical protein